MVSNINSAMYNFPSPWRVNHAGEVVRDTKNVVEEEEDEVHLQKVSSPSERKSLFASSGGGGTDENNNKTKGKSRESWFRRKNNKKDNKQGGDENNALNFENIFRVMYIVENMQCFTCGPMGENANDGKKKKKLLPRPSGSKKENKADDGKSKKEKIKKKEPVLDATSKDKGSAKPEPKTKWFQKNKNKQQDEPGESAQYDIWAAVVPHSFISNSNPDESKGGDSSEKEKKQEKKGKLQWFRLSSTSTKGKQEKKEPLQEAEKQQETKDPQVGEELKGCDDLNGFSTMITALVSRETEHTVVTSASTQDGTKKEDRADATDTAANGDAEKDKKQEKKSKLQWFRLSSKRKEEKKEAVEEGTEETKKSPEEEPKGFDFNELSAMITALVNRETEQAANASESIQDGTKKEGTDGTDTAETKEIDPNAENSVALWIWFDRLKSEGEGYIRFVSGSDPTKKDPPTSTTNTGTISNTTPNYDEEDETIFTEGSQSTEFSSYEVPSLLQEMKMIAGFGKPPKNAASRYHSKDPQQPVEDDNFLLRKIANDPSSRSSKDNTLTLQSIHKEGTPRDHGFKVKLHEDRTLCEV